MLDLPDRVRRLAAELERMTVCNRSGGEGVVNFSDQEIVQAVAFLRQMTRAPSSRAFLDAIVNIDNY